QITTPMAPGSVFSIFQPFQVSWKSDGLDAIVRMRLSHPYPEGSYQYCECAVRASDQSVTIGLVPTGINNTKWLPILPGQNSVVVTVTPSAATTLSPAGLTQPASHTWVYEYDFEGLILQD